MSEVDEVPSREWWTLACTTVVGILFARRLYTLFEKLVLFIVAVMAASFVATAGGNLVSDGLGFGNELASWRVRAGILGVLGFGALVTVLARGESPVQLIIAAQALTVVVAPVLAVLLLVLANRRGLMGDLRNRWWQNVLAAIGLVAIAAVCYQLAVTSFS